MVGWSTQSSTVPLARSFAATAINTWNTIRGVVVVPSPQTYETPRRHQHAGRRKQIDGLAAPAWDHRELRGGANETSQKNAGDIDEDVERCGSSFDDGRGATFFTPRRRAAPSSAPEAEEKSAAAARDVGK